MCIQNNLKLLVCLKEALSSRKLSILWANYWILNGHVVKHRVGILTGVLHGHVFTKKFTKGTIKYLLGCRRST